MGNKLILQLDYFNDCDNFTSYYSLIGDVDTVKLELMELSFKAYESHVVNNLPFRYFEYQGHKFDWVYFFYNASDSDSKTVLKQEEPRVYTLEEFWEINKA